MFSACKKLLCSLFVILLVSVGGTAGSVQADVPPTSAEAACLIDADTGRILYRVNPDKWVHPASTTKIVTMITALDQGKAIVHILGSSQYGTILPGHCPGRPDYPERSDAGDDGRFRQ